MKAKWPLLLSPGEFSPHRDVQKRSQTYKYQLCVGMRARRIHMFCYVNLVDEGLILRNSSILITLVVLRNVRITQANKLWMYYDNILHLRLYGELT